MKVEGVVGVVASWASEQGQNKDIQSYGGGAHEADHIGGG